MAEADAVVSIEALEQIAPALRRFRQFVAEHLQRVKADLRQVRESLVEARSDAARVVRQLQSEIASADEDDDTSGPERELDEARDRLRKIEYALRNMGEHTAIYEREAERFRRVADEHIPRSEAFLARKADDLHSLHAIQPVNDQGWMGMTAQSGADIVETAIQISAGMLDLTTSPLPTGYCWVKLSDLDLVDAFRDVQTPEDFRAHATYDMLCGGLETLRNTVLPAIRERGYSADSFYFTRLDETTGCNSENGARRVFESFFGDEPIVLQRGVDGGPFTVINGRHRIKAARDGGWLAVPVKITGGKG